MKKIPTLFERTFEDHKLTGITDKVTPGMEWVLEGEGVATIKYDGACCAIFGEGFYRRYDAKPGRMIPSGAVPCCDPDPITGHWPHWVPVDMLSSGDKWFAAAGDNSFVWGKDGTYEAIGPHFQGNPYELSQDCLVKHGADTVEVPRSFEGIRAWLKENKHEGLVFWKDREPQCKIKRKDFGLSWPIREEHHEA